MSNAARSVMRSVKNYTKGYSDIQNKVRSATSNSPDSASTTLMAEIADATYNTLGLVEVMEIIDKRLNDKGKYWRHVYKSLILIDYLLRFGSEKVISYCQQNIYIIKTLKEFLYIDEQGYDRGLNVRQKATSITELLTDRDKLKKIRSTRPSSYKRENSPSSNNYGGSNYRRDNRSGNSIYKENEEERQLRLAIEESKKEATRHQESLKGQGVQGQRDISTQDSGYNEDAALQKALKDSALEASLASNSQASASANPNNFTSVSTSAGQNKTSGDLLLDLSDGWNMNNNNVSFPIPVTQNSQNMFSQSTMNMNNGFQNDMLAMGSTSNAPFNTYSTGFTDNQHAQGNTLVDLNSQYTLQNNMPLTNTASFNPFNQSTQIGSTDNNFNAPNHPFNVTGQFGNVFDTGSTSKPLPSGINASDPSAKLAEIARNSNKIDPFASLAASSSTNIQPVGSSTNPFEVAQSAATTANHSQANGTNSYSSVFGINLSQNTNMVDLSPQALVNNNLAQSQITQQNPFMSKQNVSLDPFGNTQQVNNFNNNSGLQQTAQHPFANGGQPMNQNTFAQNSYNSNENNVFNPNNQPFNDNQYGTTNYHNY